VRRLLVVSLVMMAGLAVTGVRAESPALPSDAKVLTLNRRPVWRWNANTGVGWLYEERRPGVEFMAFDFREVRSLGGDWRLDIERIGPGGPTVVFTQSSVPDGGGVVTPDLPGDWFVIRLSSSTVAQPVDLILANVQVAATETSIKSIVNKAVGEQFEPPSVLEGRQEFARPLQGVALVRSGHPPRRRTCTGVFLTADLVLTNDHCFDPGATCGGTTIVPHNGSARSCVAIEDRSYALDFALLRVTPGDGQGGLALSLATSVVRKVGLVMLQYPDGLPLRVTRAGGSCGHAACEAACRADDNPVANRRTSADPGAPLAPARELTHSCDTKGGSSGSPIFLEDGTLLALHNFNFDENAIKRRNRGIFLSAILCGMRESVRSEIVPGGFQCPWPSA
jgi:hypothetical protein